MIYILIMKNIMKLMVGTIQMVITTIIVGIVVLKVILMMRIF